MSDLDLDVAFNINEAEVANATNATKERIRSVATEAKAVGAATKSNFNGLQNSINQLSRELPAFTFSAQTGFLAISNNIPILVDELGRLKTANAALVASGQTATPVWKQLIGSLFSWGTALSLGVTLLTVYGKEIGNFFISLFKGKASIDALKESQKDLSKAMGSAGEAAGKATLEVAEMNQKFRQAKDGVISKSSALKAYNDGIGKTLGYTKDFNIAEERTLQNGGAFIDLMFKKARAAAILKLYTEQMAKAAEAMAKTSDEAGDYLLSGSKGKLKNIKGEDLFEASAQRNRKAEAKPFEEKAAEFKKMWLTTNDESAAFAKANKLDLYGKSDKPADNSKADENSLATAISGRKSVLDKLAQLDAEYSRKSFTKDEEEKQALKDKFTAFRKIITDENNKIAEYNKTHTKKVGTIDIAGVDPIEKRAKEDLDYRQDTDKLKISLDEQKRLYTEYENYKTSFGETKANERFSKELNTSKTYLQALTEEQDKLTAQQSKGALDGPQKERLKLVGDALKAETQITQDNYLRLLTELQSFEDKRTAIREKAIAIIQQLVAKGDNIEAENQRIKTQAELTEFDKKRVEQLDSYKKLFDNIDQLSTSALRKSLSDLQKEVGKLTLTPKAKEFFDKMFGDVKSKVNSSSASDFKNIASALGEAAQYAGTFSEGLGTALGTAAQIAGQIGSIKQGMADFKTASAKGDTVGQVTSGLGLISTAIGVVSLVAGLFSKSKEIAEQRKYEEDMQLKAVEAVNKALERQLALTKEIQGPERIAAYKKDMQDIAKMQDALTKEVAGKQTLTGNKNIDYEIAKRNGGDFDSGWFESINKQLLAAGQSISLVGKSMAELQVLMDSGKLDANTSNLLKRWFDLEKQAKETKNALAEEATGINFDGLKSDIKAVFDSRETDVENFAAAIEKNIKRAFSKSFERNEIEKAMQPFYDELDAAGNDGTFTTQEIAELRAKKEAIATALAEKAKAYQAIIGVDPADPTTGSNTIANEVKGITVKEANLLAGQIGGQRLAQLDGNQANKAGFATLASSMGEQMAEMRAQHLTQKEIAANTLRAANNTDNLDTGLTAIKDEVGKVVTKVGNSSGGVLAANGKG